METVGRNEVPSPCTNVCAIDRASDLCAGCLRTIDEIGAWDDMSNEEKRDVLRRISQRRDCLDLPGERAAG